MDKDISQIFIPPVGQNNFEPIKRYLLVEYPNKVGSKFRTQGRTHRGISHKEGNETGLNPLPFIQERLKAASEEGPRISPVLKGPEKYAYCLIKFIISSTDSVEA